MPIAAGVALVAAGLLGMHVLGPRTVTANTLQPSRAQLRNMGLKSARLFQPYQIQNVYTLRAPNFKRQGTGVSGTWSQILVVLGTRRGGILAVNEAAGPLFGDESGFQETGWATVLPPASRPVLPERLAQLPSPEHRAVLGWARERGLQAARLTIWPFPVALLVVATEHGQSMAATFSPSGVKPTYVLGTPGAPVFQGKSITVVLKGTH